MLYRQSPLRFTPAGMTIVSVTDPADQFNMK